MKFTSSLGLETSIGEGFSTGDVIIRQDRKIACAHYDYWPAFLIQGIIFCYQTKTPVPNPRNFSTTKRNISLFEFPTLLKTIHFSMNQNERELIPNVNEEVKFDKFRFGYDSGLIYTTRISKGGNLIYLEEGERLVTTFTPQDMPNFFQGFTEPMIGNVRGTRKFPEIIYSEFPWDFYKI